MTLFVNDIKPLKEYLGDKKEMIEVIFSCIEDNQLKKMTPDCLKDAKIEDIKAECLVELLGMSKKRIMGILEGKELDESSEDSLELSDISDDDSNIKTERESPEKQSSKKKGSKESKNKGGRKVSKITSSESDLEEEETTSKKKKMKKRKEDSPDKVSPPKKKKNKVEPSKETENIADSIDMTEGTEENKGGKNLLEILELEMRARAIRSLIEREEKKGKVMTKEPTPSTSNHNKPEVHLDLVDNDPDAVIIIDEAADQIDLTKDESDSEDPTMKNKSDKPVIPQPRIYRNNSQHTASDKQASKSVENVNLDDGSSQAQTSENYVPRNWTERWLDSNDVQKVMKTTKVLTNLKKRLIKVNKQKSLEEKNNEETVNTEPTVIEGTVSEYSQLQKKTPDNDKEIDTATNSTNQQMNLDAELTVETFITKDEMNIITEESEDNKITDTSSETVESIDLQKSAGNSIETPDNSERSLTEDTTQPQGKTKVLQQNCELIDSESEKDEKSESEN